MTNRWFPTLMMATACATAIGGAAQAQTFRDEFNTSHDYSGGVLPAGTIWDGVHNPGNGLGAFNANTTTPGSLHFGGKDVGWGGNLTNGRMLYKNVPSSQFRQVSAKVTNQTAGFWSTAGVIARLDAGPVDDAVYTDEYFVTAASFLTGGAEFGGNGASLQGQNIVAGPRIAEPNTTGLFSTDVAYVRLVHVGTGSFDLYSSADGATWTLRHSIENPAMASGNFEVGIYGGDFLGGLVDPIYEFDWAEVVVGAPTVHPLLNWDVNGSGDWNGPGWDIRGGTPNANATTAVLGSINTGPATIYNNQDVTVKGLQFNSPNAYAIGGAGSITLAADAGAATVQTLAGSHQILVDLSLGTDAEISATGSAALNVNAPVSVNGHNLTLSGNVALNNGIDLGGGSLSLLAAATAPLTIGGWANLDGGELIVDFADGFAPTGGDVIPLLTADGLSAAGVTLGGDAATGFALGVSGGSLFLTAIPEPASLALVAGGAVLAFARRRRAVVALAVVALLTCAVADPAAAQTFRDDFNTFHDYSGASTGGASGTVPAGGMWTGIHNATNGGDEFAPGFFVSNGADFDGNPKTGVLFIEDLNLHVNTNATLGIGWEANITNAPFLYREVPASKDFVATMKISNETAGFWANTAIMARVKGPEPGFGRGDDASVFANENFITAATFRIDEAAPQNANMIMQNVINNVETEANIGVLTPNPTPTHVRLQKQGNTFTGFMSQDGVTFSTAPQLTFVHPNFTNDATMEVGLGHWRYQGTAGSAEIDWFELVISDPPTLTEAAWKVNASGNWLASTNWEANFPAAPNNVEAAVTLGDVITAPQSVFANATVTAKSLTFSSPHKYAVTGTGALNLQANTGNAGLNATVGAHEVQLPVVLGSNTDANLADGSSIELNNEVDLAGKTLAVSGAGTLYFNNNLDSGASGQVNNAGSIGGTGRINAAVANASGVVGPGTSTGKLTIDGSYTQGASGTLAIEIGGVGEGEFDVLAILGAATLGGMLDVSLVDEYLPSGGESFTVLTANSIANNGLTLGGSAAGLFSLSVTANSVVLNATGGGLLADFNGDGKVDNLDLTAPAVGWEDRFGVNLDGGDLLQWQREYGSVAAAASVSAIPEPTAALLACWGAVGLLSRSARRRR